MFDRAFYIDGITAHSIMKYKTIQVYFSRSHFDIGIFYLIKALSKIYFESRILQPAFARDAQVIKCTIDIDIAGEVSLHVREKITQEPFQYFDLEIPRNQ